MQRVAILRYKTVAVLRNKHFFPFLVILFLNLNNILLVYITIFLVLIFFIKYRFSKICKMLLNVFYSVELKYR